MGDTREKGDKPKSSLSLNLITGHIIAKTKLPSGEFATLDLSDGSMTHGVEEKTDPWVIGLLEDSKVRHPYNLGGLMHRFDFSEGITGRLQRIVEDVGNVGGMKIPHYEESAIAQGLRERLGKRGETIFNFVTHRALAHLLSYTVFQAHREGLRRVQKESGLSLFTAALGWQYESPQEQIAQLASIFDTMPDDLQPQAIGLGQNQGLISSLQNKIEIPVPVYYESEVALFPDELMEKVTERPQHLPSWSDSLAVRPFLGQLSGLVTSTTVERVSKNLLAPISAVSSRQPLSVVSI